MNPTGRRYELAVSAAVAVGARWRQALPGRTS